jgi:hypothetical protein
MSELILPKEAFDSSNPVPGILARSYHLFGKPVLNGLTAAATVTGPWVDIRVLKAANFHLKGTFDGASVQLYASLDNDPQPADTGVAVGAAITANSLAALAGLPYRYVRAVLTNAGVNTSLSAVLHGVA